MLDKGREAIHARLHENSKLSFAAHYREDVEMLMEQIQHLEWKVEMANALQNVQEKAEMQKFTQELYALLQRYDLVPFSLPMG